MRPATPALLLFNPNKYITATHADYSLLGPTSMSVPGYPFKPAQPNERILLYATGFGTSAVTLAEGAAVQFGALSVKPTATIGGAAATVEWAGVISPGLYQLNVVVPADAANGDSEVLVTFNGQTTQAGAKIAVQR
jgi:uncharacterized protein (TIGR03437 family)